MFVSKSELTTALSHAAREDGEQGVYTAGYRCNDEWLGGRCAGCHTLIETHAHTHSRTAQTLEMREESC